MIVFFLICWLFGFLLIAAFRIAMFILVLAVAAFGICIAAIFSAFETRRRESPVREFIGVPGMPRCDECGIFGGHRGTCSRSIMRGGASEAPTLEMWPGQR